MPAAFHESKDRLCIWHLRWRHGLLEHAPILPRLKAATFHSLKLPGVCSVLQYTTYGRQQNRDHLLQEVRLTDAARVEAVGAPESAHADQRPR
jgi:hypothetical protein